MIRCLVHCASCGEWKVKLVVATAVDVDSVCDECAAHNDFTVFFEEFTSIDSTGCDFICGPVYCPPVEEYEIHWTGRIAEYVPGSFAAEVAGFYGGEL